MRSKADRARLQEAELPRTHARRWLAFTALTAFLLLIALSLVPLLIWVLGTDGADAPDAVTAAGPLLGTAVGLLLTVLLILALVLFMDTLARFRRELNAWWRAPIDVAEFTCLSGGIEGRHPTEITARFREYLSHSRLPVAASMPGPTSGLEFLEVVESTTTSSSSLLGGLARYVRSSLIEATPAYKVACEIRPGDDATKTGLIVHVTRVPHGAATPIIVQQQYWEHAVEQAAHAVAALVLPRTRQCRDAPWRDWYKRAIPAELYLHFQRGRKYLAQRRYDEALAAYYQALRSDPANMHIRAQIGLILEQLNLSLDAFVTYTDIIAHSLRHRTHRRRLRAPEEVQVLARYRRALLLGNAEHGMVSEWCKPPSCTKKEHWSRIDHRREFLRSAARQRLRSELKRNGDQKALDALEIDPSKSHESTTSLCPPGYPIWSKSTPVELRAALCKHAARELVSLEADVLRWSQRWRWPPRQRRQLNALLPPRGLRLSLVWVALRHSHSLKEAGKLSERTLVPNRYRWRQPHLARLSRSAANACHPKFGDLRAAVEEALNRPKGNGDWQEHYNAACVYAVSLFDDLETSDEEKVVSAAVEQLRLAVAQTDSSQLAQKRAWLLLEDPDLEHLRKHSQFTQFETEAFAHDRPPPLRGGPVAEFERSGYMAAIIRSAADRMAGLWFERAQRAHWVTPGELERWCAEEERGWRMARQLAFGYEDWRTRADVLRQLSEWSTLYGKAPLRVGYPDFESRVQKLGDGHADVLENRIDADNERMNYLATDLTNGSDAGDSFCKYRDGEQETLKEEREAWETYLHRVNENGENLVKSTVKRLCKHRAARWRALGAWYTDKNEPDFTTEACRRCKARATFHAKLTKNILPN